MKRNKKIGIGILLVSIFAISGCSKSLGDAASVTNKGVESDSLSEFEPNLISMTTYANGICQNWIPEMIDDTRISNDIQLLRWIVPRGGIGIEEPASEQYASDNLFLSESNRIFEEYSSQMEENWYFDFEDYDKVWVRFNYDSYEPAEGVNDIVHKDIMLYIEDEDLYFAIQDVDNEQLWTITKVPGYGSWMEKELELFYRLYMGF